MLQRASVYVQTLAATAQHWQLLDACIGTLQLYDARQCFRQLSDACSADV
jgi:hypothetical protein